MTSSGDQHKLNSSYNEQTGNPTLISPQFTFPQRFKFHRFPKPTGTKSALAHGLTAGLDDFILALTLPTEVVVPIS